MHVCLSRSKDLSSRCLEGPDAAGEGLEALQARGRALVFVGVCASMRVTNGVEVCLRHRVGLKHSSVRSVSGIISSQSQASG